MRIRNWNGISFLRQFSPNRIRLFLYVCVYIFGLSFLFLNISTWKWSYATSRCTHADVISHFTWFFDWKKNAQNKHQSGIEKGSKNLFAMKKNHQTNWKSPLLATCLQLLIFFNFRAFCFVKKSLLNFSICSFHSYWVILRMPVWVFNPFKTSDYKINEKT